MSKENVPASTHSDDADFNAGQDYQNYDDIPVPMGAMAEALGLVGDDDESLPDDDESDLDPEDSVDGEVPEDDATDEDETDDSDEPSEEDDEDEDDSDEDSTQDDELPSEEEIDWDYKVPVKIDGEVKHLSLEELRKGFATDQHLSKKGRETSELKKELEETYETKLGELTQLGNLLGTQLKAKSNEYAQEYHALNKKIEEARDSGDTYELGELKDKREQAQENYWKAEKEVGALAEQFEKRQKDQIEKYQKEALDTFNKEIEEFIPNYDEDYAKSVREFAVEEGIPEELLGQVLSAKVVHFIDNYRQLKQKANSGASKRKKAPKMKGVPAKKTPKQTRARRQQTAVRDKVFSGEASQADELSFLKSLSKFQ